MCIKLPLSHTDQKEGRWVNLVKQRLLATAGQRGEITMTEIKSKAIGLIILMLTTCGRKDLEDLTLVCVKI